MSWVDRLRPEWESLRDATTLDMLPKEALIASIKELANRLLYVTAFDAPRTKTGRIIFEEDFEEWAAEAEAGYDPERINARSSGHRLLRDMELVAWVGADEFDGSRGIKAGVTPAGYIPLATKGEDVHKLSRQEFVDQMQELADQYGKDRYLARFRFDGIILEVNPQ